MQSPNDNGAHFEGGRRNKTEALVAAAELERRKHESSKRLAQLEQKRRMLEEIRDSLEDEQSVVARQLAAAQGDHDRISQQLEDMTRCLVEMEHQVEQHKREISVLNRRCSDSQSRQQKLLKEIASAEELLRNERNAIFSVFEELEMGRALLTRMDQRLSLHRTKHRAVPDG